MSIVGGIDVSRETIERLEAFAALVAQWTKRINLVSVNSVDQIWQRHIEDSAQIFQYAGSNCSRWVDLGSGGGFPGIVLAILARELNPTVAFILVESDLRKATFLRTAARTLDLNVSVESQRIEALAPLNGDVVSARALASLSALLPMVNLHLAENGTAILPKGRKFADEIAQARESWDFDLEEYQSITEDDARVLVLKRINEREV